MFRNVILCKSCPLTLSKQGKINWASDLCILCWFPSMHATLQTFSHPQLRLITSSIAWTKHHVSAKLSWFFQTGFLRWGTDGDIISGIPVYPSNYICPYKIILMFQDPLPNFFRVSSGSWEFHKLHPACHHFGRPWSMRTFFLRPWS